MGLLYGQTATGKMVPILVDEDGKLSLVSGGGGGGDATAANQVLGLTALDNIYSALQLVGTEATSADILAAVNSLASGATLADLATALAPLATEATQADVLTALQAQGVDIASTLTAVNLLVTQTDGIEGLLTSGNASLASLDGKAPSALAAEHTTAASPHAARLTDGTSFYKGIVRGDDVKADLRVGGGDVANGNPVPVSDAGGSLTVDSPQLPAALTSGGGVKTGIVDALPAGESTIGAVRFDRAHLSPFSHLVAQPLSFVAQGSFTYGINTFVGTTAASGTGALVDTTSGVLRVQSGTGSAGDATYLCNEALIYRGGQGAGITWSQAFPAGVASNTTIGGPSTTATNADGYFFGTKGTSFGIHHYRSGSEVQFIAQASWNGTVPAGFDSTKFNVYDVRYSSGAGDIFFMIQDPTTGFPYVVHTIRYASTSTILSVSSPSMKFLVRSVNSGSTTNVTTLVGAFGQYLFGTPLVDGPPFAYNYQKAVTGGVETNIFSIRVATTLNGVTNRGAARVRLATAVADNGNTITAFYARLGATIGGSPSFSPYNGSTADNGVTLTSAQSMLSFDTAGTTATGAATTVAINTGCARNSQVPIDFTHMNIELRPGETWTISAQPGANCNCGVFVNGVETW